MVLPRIHGFNCSNVNINLEIYNNEEKAPFMIKFEKLVLKDYWLWIMGAGIGTSMIQVHGYGKT